MKRAIVMLVTAILGLVGPEAPAATYTQQFTNDYATNSIYFWSSDVSNMSFGSTTFSGATSAWTVTSNTGAMLEIGGGTVAPATGLFNLQFNYQSTPFAFEWAELYFNGSNNTLLGAGTLSWNGSNWSGNSAFTHLSAINPSAPVPVPASFLLLGSAALGLVMVGRRQHAKSAMIVRS